MAKKERIIQHKILFIPEKRHDADFYEVRNVYGHLVEVIPEEYLEVELNKFQVDKYFLLCAKDSGDRVLRVLIHGVKIENGVKLPEILEA